MAADARRGPGALAAALAGAALAAALGGCGDVPVVDADAPGYDPRLSVGGGFEVYHWPLGRTIAVYVDASEQPAGRDLADAVRRGAALWRSVLYYREFDMSLVARPADADVIVHFEDAEPLVETGAACAGALAAGGITFFCLNDAGTAFVPLAFRSGAAASHVRFDVTISNDPLKIPGDERFRAVVAHELGHVLGIGSHSNDPGDLMWPGPVAPVASPRDARTLRWLLHQPATLRL
jgi:hypothetical protein